VEPRLAALLEDSDLRAAWAVVAKKDVPRAVKAFQASGRGRRAAAEAVAAGAAAAYLRRPEAAAV
jgi:hypothetical protein